MTRAAGHNPIPSIGAFRRNRWGRYCRCAAKPVQGGRKHSLPANLSVESSTQTTTNAKFPSTPAPHRPAPHAWKIHHNHGDFVAGGIIAGVVGGIVSSALSSQSPTYVVSENAAANTVTYSVPNQKNCTTFVSAYGDVTQHCVSSY